MVPQKIRTAGFLAGAIALLAACEPAGGLGVPTDPTVPGIDPNAEDVDGLLVGHRLMAVGEYELALKAYLRSASQRGMTVDTLSAIGSANLQLGRLGQAESILRRATEADETFPPAWNNLGVVLMETGRYGEAARVFQLAFALDSGQSAEIRENLRLALAKLENPAYSSEAEGNYRLVRRGNGVYDLLSSR